MIAILIESFWIIHDQHRRGSMNWALIRREDMKEPVAFVIHWKNSFSRLASWKPPHRASWCPTLARIELPGRSVPLHLLEQGAAGGHRSWRSGPARRTCTGEPAPPPAPNTRCTRFAPCQWSGPVLLDHDPAERLADLAPVAPGAALLGHLKQVLELVLRGLTLTADPEVQNVHQPLQQGSGLQNELFLSEIPILFLNRGTPI